jgi:hypothetical protein
MSQQSQQIIFHIYTSETGKNALYAAREMKDARYSVDISEESHHSAAAMGMGLDLLINVNPG